MPPSLAEVSFFFLFWYFGIGLLWAGSHAVSFIRTFQWEEFPDKKVVKVLIFLWAMFYGMVMWPKLIGWKK